MDGSLAPSASPALQQDSLSYKFQRLRERLRQAIVSGELAGKLPGERVLAQRFDANPKTLGKALTDLAAEGLLERSIGRGTYVKGSARAAEASQDAWMILCDAGQVESSLVREFARIAPASEIVAGEQKLRPSFLNQFNTVIDLSSGSSDSLHRTLLVRGMFLVLVGREDAPYRLNSVLLDRAYAAAGLARDLLLGGHRSILVVEPGGQTTVSRAVRTAITRYVPYAGVQTCTVQELPSHLGRGATAVLCDGADCAAQVRRAFADRAALRDVSLAAVGVCEGDAPCTGIYATPADVAQAVRQMMETAQMHRPVTLWLSGTYVDRGTVRAVPELRMEAVNTASSVAMSA